MKDIIFALATIFALSSLDLTSEVIKGIVTGLVIGWYVTKRMRGN